MDTVERFIFWGTVVAFFVMEASFLIDIIGG